MFSPMKKFKLLFCLLIGVNQLLPAQDTLLIPFAPAPVLDGHADSMEWAHATWITIDSSSHTTVAAIMHDSFHLYILMAGSLESRPSFPEICIDPNFDRSSSWMPDDWWFHLSATDCESQGVPSAFTLCLADPPDWSGVPNFTPSPSDAKVDTVEIAIPWAKVYADTTFPDTIGIALLVAPVFTGPTLWPGPAQINQPDSWGIGLVQRDTMTMVNTIDPLDDPFTFQLGPNPVHIGEPIQILLRGWQSARLTIFNSQGAVIHKEALPDHPGTSYRYTWKPGSTNEQSLNPGVYYLRIESKEHIAVQKLVLFH